MTTTMKGLVCEHAMQCMEAWFKCTKHSFWV